MDGPPDVAGAGWLISESARGALAHRLGLPEDAVVLAFIPSFPWAAWPCPRAPARPSPPRRHSRSPR
jgi:hypothetical protein